MALNYAVINNKTIINSEYLGENVYNLLDKTFTIPESYTYNILTVSDEYIARPDLISYDAYGDTMYGDIICKLNGISNPFELNKGMRIVIPEANCIDQFIINEADVEVDNTSDIKPKPKKKNDKRGPNEAIIGDSRFRIDKASNIVIY